jgi:mannose-6-phosphate isomerase-like protein (cupin superfamily)
MTIRSSLNAVAPFKTKDGSPIRELMHPQVHGNAKQSLAQAVVPVADRTISHYHKVTEELYHIKQGYGVITLDDVDHDVAPGDTVLIEPGVIHCVRNTGEIDLLIFCCCAPAYSHDDTYCTD